MNSHFAFRWSLCLFHLLGIQCVILWRDMLWVFGRSRLRMDAWSNLGAGHDKVYVFSLPKAFNYKFGFVFVYSSIKFEFLPNYKFMSYLCLKPLTTGMVLYLSIIPLGFSFFLRTHLDPIALQPWGRFTKCQVLFDSRGSISSLITSCHKLASILTELLLDLRIFFYILGFEVISKIFNFTNSLASSRFWIFFPHLRFES